MHDVLIVNVDNGKSKKVDTDYPLSKNFKVWEFVSRDCEVMLYSQYHVDCLQALRDYYSKPINITNSFRTITHNDDVSAYDNSKHQYGYASDIVIKGESAKDVKLVASEIFGYWSQIITYKNTNHVHVGTYPNEHLRLYHNGVEYINVKI